MKRTVASGFLALVGALWVFRVGDWVNAHLLTETRSYGNFFMETLTATPAALILMLMGVIVMGWGLVALMIDFFRK